MPFLQLDYLFFALTAAAAFAGIHWAMRRRGARQRIEKRVSGMAPTYAHELSLMGHAGIGLDTRADDPAYLAMIKAQKRWLATNRGAHDIYTIRKLPDGRNVFIVDSETDYDRNGVFEGERESRTAIGEVYDVDDPGLEQALAGEANFDSRVVTDRWGTWVSAWVPMRDESASMADGLRSIANPAGDRYSACFSRRAPRARALPKAFRSPRQCAAGPRPFSWSRMKRRSGSL